jgi:hypothetical protein
LIWFDFWWIMNSLGLVWIFFFLEKFAFGKEFFSRLYFLLFLNSPTFRCIGRNRLARARLEFSQQGLFQITIVFLSNLQTMELIAVFMLMFMHV